MEEDEVKLEIEEQIEIQLAKMKETEARPDDSSKPKEEPASEHERHDTPPVRYLDDVLAENVFSGSFYFSETYPDAPNPLLHLEGVGVIGLPLSEREAAFIISTVTSQSDTTSQIDASPRTIEVAAAQANIASEEWENFLEGIAKDACRELGVDYAVNLPKHVLRKISVSRAGSPDNSWSIKPGLGPGAFATTAVFLPSHYETGSAHLSHDERSAVIDFSDDSLFSTAALSWYTDVSVTVRPINAGCRITLLHDLIQMADAPRPNLEGQCKAREEVRQMLEDWKKHAHEDALTLSHTLGHRTSKEEQLSGRVLIGIDARKVVALQELGGKVDIQLGLAQFMRWEYGSAYPDSDEEIDLQCPQKWHPEREEYSGQFVTLDGHVLQKRHRLAGNSHDLFEDWECDEHATDYIPYGRESSDGGTVQKIYTRTVLVLWHLVFDEVVRAGKDPTSYAVTALAKVTREASSPLERMLFRHLTASRLSDWKLREQGVRLCEIASLWKDAELWTEAADFSTQGRYIYSDEVVEALTNSCLDALPLFGFRQVRITLDTLREYDYSVRRRWNAIDTVEGIISQDQDQDIMQWIKKYRHEVAHALRQFRVADVPSVLRVALHFGGLTFLQRVLLPQLQSLKDAQVILEVVIVIQSDDFDSFRLVDLRTFDHVLAGLLMSATPKLKDMQYEEAAFKALIVRLCTARVRHTFPESTPIISTIIANLMDTVIREHQLDTPQRIIDLLEFCYRTGNEECCRSVLAVIAGPDFATLKTMLNILVPLLGKLSLFLQQRGAQPSAEPYASLFKEIVLHFVMNVMPPRPLNPTALVAKMTAYECPCEDCPTLVTFLTTAPTPDEEEEAKSHSFLGIGFVRKQHLEKQLEKHGGTAIASWETLQPTKSEDRYSVRFRGPVQLKQGLKVSRSDQLYSALLWPILQEIGVAAVKAISDSQAVIQQTFGDDYDTIMTALSGGFHDADMTEEDRVEELPVRQPPRRSTRATAKRKRSAAEEVIDLTSP